MRLRNTLVLIALSTAACVGQPRGAATELAICADGNAPQKAIAACSTLIESGEVAGKSLASVRANRASAYFMTGSQDLALADLNEAMQSSPGDARIYGLRGAVRGMKGDLDGAIADFTVSIDGDPSLVDSYTNRGKALSDKGEFERSIGDFDRALQLQSDNAFALNGRCWSRAVLNTDLDAALADCNAGVEAGGDDLANTLNSQGFAHFRRAEYREAITSYNASLQQNPRMASSYYVRGLSKRALGEQDADTDIARALSLEQGIRERYARYGVTP